MYDKIVPITKINDDILENPDYNGMYTIGYKCKIMNDYNNAVPFDDASSKILALPGYADKYNLYNLNNRLTIDTIKSYMIMNIQNIIIFETFSFVAEVAEDAGLEKTVIEYDRMMNKVYGFLLNNIRNTITPIVSGIDFYHLYTSIAINLVSENIVSWIPCNIIEPIILDMYNYFQTINPDLCKKLYENNIDEDTSGLERNISASGWQAITSIMRQFATSHILNMQEAIMKVSETASNMYIDDVCANSNGPWKYNANISMEDKVQYDNQITHIFDIEEDE